MGERLVQTFIVLIQHYFCLVVLRQSMLFFDDSTAQQIVLVIFVSASGHCMLFISTVSQLAGSLQYCRYFLGVMVVPVSRPCLLVPGATVDDPAVPQPGQAIIHRLMSRRPG